MARILVVDDDEIVGDVIVEALAAAGHSVNVVYRGEEALPALDESGAELIILDYNLPGISGLEVLRQLRQLPYGQDVSVLMLTAKTGQLLPARAHHDDVDDFLNKPVSVDLLIQRVEALLKSSALARNLSQCS